jgi:hypothetical protein
MNTPVLLLSAISLGTLVLGLLAWRLTSSKPLILNVVFTSAAFLIAAYGIATQQPGPLTVIMPFLVTMLLAGRALGIYWRTFYRGESDLRAPAHLLGGAVAICSLGSWVAFLSH